jgi:hypothetical protein
MANMTIDNGGTVTRSTGVRRVRHRVTLACVLALTCFAALSAAAAEHASASACGPQTWTAFTANIGGQTIPIPGGLLDHCLEGSGTFVRSDEAWVYSAASLCNWRIDFTYLDVLTGRTDINRGLTNFSCNRYGHRVTVLNAHKSPGKACAELYSNGAFVTRQCHSITR